MEKTANFLNNQRYVINEKGKRKIYCYYKHNTYKFDSNLSIKYLAILLTLPTYTLYFIFFGNLLKVNFGDLIGSFLVLSLVVWVILETLFANINYILYKIRNLKSKYNEKIYTLKPYSMYYNIITSYYLIPKKELNNKPKLLELRYKYSIKNEYYEITKK